jgi:hypothetical protein
MFALDDQIIDGTMGRALHAEACRDHIMVVWMVMWDDPHISGPIYLPGW